MNHQELVTLYRWFDELCSSTEPAEVEQILRARIGSESDEATVRQLTFLLAEALRQQDKYEGTEDVYRLLSAKSPADPYPLLRIAEQRLYYQEDLPGAAIACNTAIEVATKHGPWRRQALGVRARIEKRLKRYAALEKTLAELLKVPNKHGVPDIGWEEDLVRAIPSGEVSQKVLDAYALKLREQEEYERRLQQRN